MITSTINWKLHWVLFLAMGMFLAMSAALFMPKDAYAGAAAIRSETLKQPNGSTFQSKTYGDEWVNWTTAQTGDVIVKGPDGYWSYAKVVGEELKPTSKRYDPKTANPIIKPFSAALKQSEAVSFARKAGASKAAARAAQAPQLSGKSVPAGSSSLIESPDTANTTPFLYQGNLKMLVILVQFNDIKMRYPDSSWQSKIFSSAPGSVRDYYNETSGGKLIWTPAEETFGTANDGIIKVTINGNHPNPSTTGSLNQEMVKNALTLANTHINFAAFDTNKDGTLQNYELSVVTIVAGYEQSFGSQTPKVWGHKWSLWGSTLQKYDNVYVAGNHGESAYAQFGEVHADHMATIGIICHELGHMIGLPDLYDVGSGSSLGVGIHSIMAYGSWNSVQGEHMGAVPNHFDAWSKQKLGFVTPEIVQSSMTNQQYTLNSIGTGQYNVLKIKTTNANDYFLLENRQFEMYDRSMAGAVDKAGIAIWHIDETRSGNYNPTQRQVDLEEANEGVIGFSEIDTYRSYSPSRPYYGVGNVTEFNGNTIPSSKNLYNFPTGLSLSVTSTPGQRMNVSVTYSIQDLSPPSQPQGLTAKAAGENGVLLEWTPSTDNIGVTGYKIYNDFVQIGTSETNSYTMSNLTVGQKYMFSVKAVDAAGKESSMSNSVEFIIQAADFEAPTKPGLLTSNYVSSTQAGLIWSDSTDNIGVAGYNIFRNGSKVSTSSSASYMDVGLSPATEYTYTVQAYDAAGNVSPMGDPITIKTNADSSLVTVYYKRMVTIGTQYMHWRPAGGQWTTAPGLAMQASEVNGYAKATVSTGGASTIEIAFNVDGNNWDSRGGSNYQVPTGTQTVENGIVKSGAPGGTAQDTTAPSIPGNLAALNKTETSVNIGWAPSTDNIGVTGYEIFRNGTKVGTASTTAYTDNGLTAGTTYKYTVLSYDAAGNKSALSSELSVTTNSTQTNNNSVTVYYKRLITTGTQYMHWRPTGGQWTNAPGLAMTASEVAGYAKANVSTGNATQLEAAFNVDGNNWDSKGGSNYSIPNGIYTVENGTVKSGAPAGVTQDTTAPSVPANLTATSKSAVSVTFGWSASTDNVAVTGYEIWRDNQKIGTSAQPSYTDGGRSAFTTYNYAVKAYDAAGNVSASSSTLSVTTDNASDTTAPSAPTNLISTAKTETSISLSWNASTDNVAVAGYEVSRNGVKVGDPTGTTFTDSGLTAGTAYSYSVKAKDAAGNVSAASNTISVTTNTTVVNNNSLTVYYKRQITTGTQYMHWRPAGGQWTTAPGLAMTASEVSGYAKATVTFANAATIEAAFNVNGNNWDSKGGSNYSIASGTFTVENGTVKTGAPSGTTQDTTAPSAPTNLNSTAKTETSVSLSWSASTDNVGVTGYEVSRNGAKVGDASGTTYTDSGLTAGTTYSYTVKAKDAAGNVSGSSNTVNVTTNSTVVNNNTLTVYYKRQITTGTQYMHWRPAGGQWTNAPGLAMSASEVTGYAKATVTFANTATIEAAFNVEGNNWDSKGGTNYSIAAGTFTIENGTVKSGAPSGTTPDTTAPSVPANLSSTGKSQTSISLSWTASTDNTAVTGYEIWRGTTKVGNASGTTYTDSGLSAGTSYSYTVKAYDAAGNVSAASAALIATTDPASANNIITIYYKRKVTTGTQNIHYRPNGGNWTTAPGVAMTNDVNGYAKITVSVGTATGIEACFNVNNTNWDSNFGSNYKVGIGEFTIENGVVKAGKP